jgi:hypothetical protein
MFDRLGKATNHTPNTHAPRKSDRCVVSKKEPNKGLVKPAETLEKRYLTKENAIINRGSDTELDSPVD